MKKFILGIVIGALITTTSFAFAENPIKLIINDKLIQTDVPPIIIDNRILVPVRFVSENLGATVQWDSANQTVIITSNDKLSIKPATNTYEPASVLLIDPTATSAARRAEILSQIPPQTNDVLSKRDNWIDGINFGDEYRILWNQKNDLEGQINRLSAKQTNNNSPELQQQKKELVQELSSIVEQMMKIQNVIINLLREL
jgi:hypothetical protein